MERHQRIQLKTTSRSTNQPFKVSSFQTGGFGVQQQAASTPASKAELWENYQRSSQIAQQGAVQTRSAIQTKLTIGQPGDKYEQEADSVADRVMAMSEPAQVQREELGEEEEELQMKPLADTISPLVQREELPEEEEELQMKPEDNLVQREELPEEEEELQMKSVDNSIQREELPEEEEELQMKQSAPSIQTATPDLESQLSSSKGGGNPLSDDVRSFMEPRFGADFSGVRVHTGSDAVQMNQDVKAQAFAHGSDVYFGAGKAPGKDALTAHELTHVVQQGGNGLSLKRVKENHSVAMLHRDSKQGDENKPLLAEIMTKTQGTLAQTRDIQNLMNATVEDGLKAIDDSRTDMVTVCNNYDKIFDTINGVLKTAGEEFKANDEMLDMAIDILIGASMAVGVSELGLAIEGSTIATKFALESVAAARDAVVGKGATIGQDGSREKRDDALKIDEKLSPTAKRLKLYEIISEQYRSLVVVSKSVHNLSGINDRLYDLVADIKVSQSGGKPTRSIDDIVAADNAIEKLNVPFSKIEASASVIRNSFMKLRNDANTAKMEGSNAKTVEQDLWINYIAELPEDLRHTILNNDKIEDYLRAVGVLSMDGKNNGRLSADFGDWTSSDDTDHAGEEAQGKVKDAVGPQQIGKIVEVYVDIDKERPIYECFVKIPGIKFFWIAEVSNIPAENMSRDHYHERTYIGKVRITSYNTSTKHLAVNALNE